MRLKLGLALSALVPVLGLFSCSKDSPTDDGWRLSAPVVESSKFNLSFKELGTDRLTEDSAIVFTPEEMTDTTTTVVSECSFNKAVYKGLTEAKAAHRFPVKALWPKELWMSANNDELKQSSCNFSFSVQHGSVVHSFELKNIRLRNFLAQVDQPQGLFAYDMDVIPSQRADVIAAAGVNLQKGLSESLQLLCENFTKRVQPAEFFETNDVEPELSNLVYEMMEGPLTTSTAIDPRFEKPVQTCRFLRTEVSPSGLTDYDLSPTFEARFAPPALKTQLTNALRTADAQSWHNQNVMNLAIQNTSNVATAISIPQTLPLIHLQLAGRVVNPDRLRNFAAGSFYKSSRIMREPVALSAQGYSRTWAIGGRVIYEIEPGQTLFVRGNLQTGASCYADISLDPAQFSQQRNIGVFYGFSDTVDLLQYRNWKTDQSLTGETVKFSEIPRGVIPDGTPVQFEPSEMYVQTISASSDIPAISQTNPWTGLRHWKDRSSDRCWFAEVKLADVVMFPLAIPAEL